MKLMTESTWLWLVAAISCALCWPSEGYSFVWNVNRREVLDLAFQTLASGTIASQLEATNEDPSQILLPIETSVAVPRVGYSLYKTEADQVPLCVELALKAGIQYFDVATQYSTNAQVGKVLKAYIDGRLDEVPDAPKSKSERRQQLFVSHKVSNLEQFATKGQIKRNVKEQMKLLGVNYLDMCSVHSPLTGSDRRLRTYAALLELQNEGLIRAVGVCNYGVRPLQEILDAGFKPPAVNQLVLSPFNQHRDVVAWAREHGTTMACAPWSKLSSAQGPQNGWAVVSEIAKTKGKTKAQILVRWALQKDYLSVPRSGSKYKIERAAIEENSFNIVRDFVLSSKEMETLDGLDEQFPVGRLGLLNDGWVESDVVGDLWDPTLAI